MGTKLTLSNSIEGKNKGNPNNEHNVMHLIPGLTG